MTIDNVAFTLKSRNAKTGPMPVTTSSHDTCPAACPLQGNGCYAEHGPLGMFWKKISVATSGAWKRLCASVAALPEGTVWRHNQAGDLPHTSERIDSAAVAALVKANAGRRGFTYTHHDPAIGNNARIIAAANRMGFTINLSGNNLAHADELKALAIAPVVVVLPIDAPKVQATPAGNRVIVCPATYRDDVTCQSCKLCSLQRDVIVGFPAHGTARRRAAAVSA